MICLGLEAFTIALRSYPTSDILLSISLSPFQCVCLSKSDARLPASKWTRSLKQAFSHVGSAEAQRIDQGSEVAVIL